jgi:hypothetical protein
MSNPIPLTGVKREAEKIVGTTIAVPYRKIYEMALNGDFPAKQIRGRWHADDSDIPDIAKVLMGQRGAA